MFPFGRKRMASDVLCSGFIFKNIYVGKEEIGRRARQYIKTHWKEPFDADKIAKAAY